MTLTMTYQEALDYLFAQLPMFSRVGAAAYKPGLERVTELATHFGNPHKHWRSVHVAGTNGKGSTSHIIAATLQSQGYRVGLYTSPHLVDFRERMRVNGEMIPEEKVVEFVERWQQTDYQGDAPSFFELTMMMAFKWFADEAVDIAVIEVGMGGRLDSTNIITPELSVITNISWDHTQFLGDTLAKIAAEKAGIMKTGIPVVIGEAEGEVEETFRRHAEDVGASIREAYREIDTEANEALHCELHGAYQEKNVNTARVAIDQLRRQGVEISREAELNGFQHVTVLTGLQGRWMKIADTPLTIADTGHNEAGLRYNMAQLQSILPAGTGDHIPTLRFVIGFVADKDVDHILDLFPGDAEYYITNAPIPRAMPADKLLAKVRERGFAARAYPSAAEAYRQAVADSNPDDVIYIGGSTFIVADFLTSNKK